MTRPARTSTFDVGCSAFGVSDAALDGNGGFDFVTPHPRYIPDYDTPRFRLTPAHSAYVKIAEGCNHPCSFCVIPQMRGRHRSRPMDSVFSGSSVTRGGRRTRDQFDQPGHNFLRNGFVAGKGRAASGGRFFTWARLFHLSYVRSRRSTAIFGCGCFTLIRPTGAMS